MLIRNLVIFILYVTLHLNAIGQVSVTLSEYEGNTSLINLSDATVVNGADKQSVHLVFTVLSSENVTLVTLFTHPFILTKGISKVNGKTLAIDSLKSKCTSLLLGDYFSFYTTLPEGEYALRWGLYNSQDSLLAFFERSYYSKGCAQVYSLPDSTGENLFAWRLANDKNTEKLAASVSFYTLKKGKLHSLEPIEPTDSLVNPIFSPEQLLTANYRTDRGKAYFYKIHIFYNSVLIGSSERVSVSKNHDLNFTENGNSLLRIFKPDNPLEKEKRYWVQQYSIKGPEKEPAFKISGTVGSESGYSNIRYLYQVTPPVYSRFIANTTVSYLGIPITTKLFLSTENTAQYPVNSFSVGLNIPQLKKNYLKKLKDRTEFEDQLKAKMKKDLKENDTYLSQLELKKSEYEKELKGYMQSGKGFENVRDSAMKKIPAMELDLPDSLKKVPVSQVDSSKYYKLLEEYNRVVYLYSKTKRRQERLKGYFELRNESPEAVLRDSVSSMPSLSSCNWERVLVGIRSFDVGIVYPLFSDVTLKGLPVKGVSALVVLPRHFFSFAMGKTLKLNAPEYVNYSPSPKFERNLWAVKGGIGNPDSTHCFVSVLHFKDPGGVVQVDSNTMISPKLNILYAVGGKLNISKRVSFEGELVSSDFREGGRYSVIEKSQVGFVAVNFFTNRAFFLKGEYNYSENTKVSLQHKIIGTGYVSLGTPFLRRGFRETEAKIQTSALKKKISVTTFFKYNIDNINHSKTYQNTLSGYGFTLRTRFRKAPNLVVTHTPFEMNSEFRPTQFTTSTLLPNLVNRFHLTSANVFYVYVLKGASAVVNLGFLNNVIQNSSGEKFSQQSFTGSVNVTLPKGGTVGIMSGVYKTLPKVDSMNVKFIEGSAGFYLFKKVSVTAGLSYHQNNPVMFKYGSFFQMGHTVKKVTLVVRGMFNFLEGNWGVGTNRELSFFLGVTYGL